MATTPTGIAQATWAVNSRSHSRRTDTGDAPAPPAAPVFLEQPLFLNALAGPSNAHKHALAPTAAPASVPMQATRVQGNLSVRETLTLLQDRDRLAVMAKRTAADLADDSSPVIVYEERPAKKRATAAAPELAAAAATATAQDVRRKSRKATAQDKEKAATENQQWRNKFRKAFPSFTFYFDAIDEPTKASLGAQVKRLGSSVDQFFSKKVTHVVTSRPVPSAAGKENVSDSPAASKVGGGMLESAAGKVKKAATRSPKMYELPNGQKLRPLVGDFDKNPFIDSQDILSKALDFGLKIWPAEKLQLMLTRINHHSPSKENGLQRDPSLPSLLRDEQLYGTRERDPFVPRTDTHYFPSNKYFLLVEDSTGEHRPIVAKEYDKPRKHEEPSWPILYGGIEGRTGFYRYDGEITYERRIPPPAPPVAPQQQQQQVANGVALAKGGFGSVAARALAPNLRRTVSLQNVAREQAGKAVGGVGVAGAHHHGRRDSFMAASGNSQTITSNIASATSTAARSGAAQASRFGANGGLVDKRLAVLSNRTVSVAGSGLAGGVARVKRMGIQRSVSVDGGLNGLRVPAAAAAAVRDEPKKPGYCENCRVKYDDFKDHVVSSKHRRFALNPKHWLELDRLLEKIERPLAVDPVDVDQYDDSGFFDAVCRSGDDSNADEDDEDEPQEDDEDDEPFFVVSPEEARAHDAFDAFVKQAVQQNYDEECRLAAGATAVAAGP
ncbi:hypothetical protein JCM8208_004900 [Rhodotorula glutinis]